MSWYLIGIEISVSSYLSRIFLEVWKKFCWFFKLGFSSSTASFSKALYFLFIALKPFAISKSIVSDATDEMIQRTSELIN